MEILGYKPIKNKKITVFLIKDEKNSSQIYNTNDSLIEFLKYLGINFVTIDLENEQLKIFNQTSISKLLDKSEIPFFPLDIPEHAKDYLFEEIIEKDKQINEFLDELLNIKDKDSIKAHYLKCWIDVLKEEINEKIKFIDLKVKPMWIVKKILDLIKIDKHEKITCLHITSEKNLPELMKLLKEVNIEVIVYNGNENSISFNIITNQGEINQWMY